MVLDRNIVQTQYIPDTTTSQTLVQSRNSYSASFIKILNLLQSWALYNE